MYNIIEKDAIGTIREHLVSLDVRAQTVCGLDSSAWEDIVEAANLRGKVFPFKQTLICRDCERLQSADEQPHRWTRNGGYWNPFKEATLRRRLLEAGAARDDERLTRLTPALHTEIKRELENAPLRQSYVRSVWGTYPVARFVDEASAPDTPRPPLCPACASSRFYRSDTNPSYECSSCDIVVADSELSLYRTSTAAPRRALIERWCRARDERHAARLSAVMSAEPAGIALTNQEVESLTREPAAPVIPERAAPASTDLEETWHFTWENNNR